jgi:hypothetical protein
MGKDPGFDGVGGNAAIAVNDDFGDEILLRPSPRAKKNYDYQKKTRDGTAQAGDP